MLRSSFAPLATLVLAMGFLLAACDSGVNPDTVTPSTPPPTISFAESSLTTSERDSTISIDVVLSNPDSSEVSAEVLFAGAASTASIADFNVDDATVLGDSSAFIIQTVSFPPAAEDGATETLTFDLIDNEDEGEDEEGIFALQSTTGGAEIGTSELRVTISGEGTVELFFEDFDEEGPALGRMTAIDVASTSNWESASFSGADNSPYAESNAFGSDEPADDWLIAPVLDLSDFNGATISFISAVGFNDEGLDEPAISLLVSTDYDGESTSPGDFTWEEVGSADIFASQSDRDGSFSPFVPSGEVDLGAFAGESTVYIAFRYVSSGTGPGSTEARQVDDIRVNGLQ